MSKKIIVLCGSPRKNGNTNTVANWFVEGAKSQGGQVEMVDAAHLKYQANGCTACMACQKTEKYECVIDDEASPIIARIPEFDVMVLATPVYWFGPTAQLKLILDRTFALVKFDHKTGEPIPNPSSKQSVLCLIATAGGELDGGLKNLDDAFRTAAGFMHCSYESLLVPLAPVNPKQMSEKVDVKEKAFALGRKIAK
jgi:multimeric flavodoxin WrbA